MEFNTIIEAVAYWAERTPDKTCLIDANNDKSISYGELWDNICVFARRLQDAGLSKGERVVVRVGPAINTVIAQFGIFLAGGIYCPVEKQMKSLKLLDMIAHYDSSFLIASENADFPGKWIDIMSVCDTGQALDYVAYPDPDSPCAIVFTTGTTGKAKGVMLNHRALSVFAYARYAALELSYTDVMLWTTPIDRVGGMRAPFIPFLAGATAAYFDGVVFIKDLLAKIKQYSVTAMYMNSFTATIILKNVPDAFADYAEQLHVVSFGGGHIAEKYKQQIKHLLPKTRLIVFYGSTEVSAISFFVFSGNTEKPNCVGKPHSCTKVFILDDNGKLLANSSITTLGTVACESECSMLGYWKDDALTAKTMVDKRVIMADVGFFDSEGYLYLMGRRDDIIVSGGHKIAPYEIEDVAMQIECVHECVCLPIPHAVMGHLPELVVAMKPGAEFSAKRIYEHLAERLETYKLPRIIKEIESFPRVGFSDKIDRMKLINGK